METRDIGQMLCEIEVPLLEASDREGRFSSV
jgi:hypothetical protein